MLAIDMRSLEIASKALQESPSIANGEDEFGTIPLFKAVENGYVPMLKLLLKYGANPKETSNSDTLLHAHCYSNNPNPDLLRFLIQQCGLEVNAVGQNGDTALHCAAISHHLPLVRTLLELGADPKKINNENETALHHAAKCILMNEKTMEIAKLLIRAGTPLYQQSNFSGTILHLASLENHVKLAQLLVKKAPDLLNIESTGSLCRTKLPLDIAKIQYNIEMISVLCVRHHQMKAADKPHESFPKLLFSFGIRKNKITGPKVAVALEKIAEKKSKKIAIETANRFIKWNHSHNRHFNLKEIKKLGLS